LVIIAGIFVATAIKNGGSVSAGDLVISKSEVTEKAKFYPYNADGTRMEILAVRAGDGSIRTAFNTCQVCNGSPRAYFKQQGEFLVCQNCGNSFSMDMVEQERGGCNPVRLQRMKKRTMAQTSLFREIFYCRTRFVSCKLENKVIGCFD